ncbi:hypothetical protein [Chondromyces apiculatus]|uniref:Uncharacterized protein n=1 Tax=Chondromyces apiculatus DSM 436 TaxID=1192034 RepID=A0A017T656_9BACT|nr:hypothetical protein [Chondromyces apiculatus]EYF04280.1 Hypothetical protein CAP_4757 [Chondromyces apiculatus DSM 436]
MQITLSARKLRPLLFALFALVVSAGLTVEVLRPLLKLKRRTGIVPLLSLSYEANLPTWYASALLFTCALTLALLAASTRAAARARSGARGEEERPQRPRHEGLWWLLAAGFTYISLDELVSLHEAAGTWMQLSGVLYFSWVVPATALLAVLGLVFWRFLADLPPPLRRRFIACGALYVTGAVLLELPLGYWAEREGTDNLGYALIDFVEESLELLAVNLFLLTLLDHLGTQRITLGFAPPPDEPAP